MPNLKYLLISPRKTKTISQSSNPNVETAAMFPVGIAYVSSSMKKAGFDVVTANGNFIESDLETTLRELLITHGINVVCTGGQSIDVNEIIDIIQIVRDTNVKIKIIVGGAIITADPETAMNVLQADIGIIGEGEEVMCELASAINNNMLIDDVNGIIFRKDETLFRSQSRPVIKDIDSLPLMDFDGFSYTKWLEANGNEGIIFTARSCPFKCTFCFKSTGSKYRARSLDLVFNEIDFQIIKYNISMLNISDELFAAKTSRVLEFCKRIKPYNINWCCSLRVPEIEENLVRLMKDCGCLSIGTGLESASPKILKSMEKRVTIQQLENALNVFANTDVIMVGNLIFGDTNETNETFEETIEFWKKFNNKTYINLGSICTLPGSHIYEQACKSGIITDKEKYLRDASFIVNISKMSDIDYFKMLSSITELSFLPQIPSQSVLIKNVDDNGLCKVEWECRRCKKLNQHNGIHFLQAPICTCSCGVQNIVEPFRSVTCDTSKLFGELPTEGNIGFWGVGSQYCRIARFYANFTSDRFIQIDANEHQQKMFRLGKKIFDPSCILEHSIQDIIITSPIARDSILKNIECNYTSVSRIYFPFIECNEGAYYPVFKPIRGKAIH